MTIYVRRIVCSIFFLGVLSNAGCAQTVSGDGGDAHARDVQCRDGDPDTSVMIYATAPCDGTTARDCQRWAQEQAGSTLVAQSVCIPIVGAHCRRATTCADLTDPSSCRCGDAGECTVGQVCAADSPGGTPFCHCISAGP